MNNFERMSREELIAELERREKTGSASYKRVADVEPSGNTNLDCDLWESRQLLHAVIEGTTDAVYAKDTNGRYLLFNSAAAGLTGKSAEEVIGRDDTFLFPPADATALMDADRNVMAVGKTMTYEENIHCASGRQSFLSTKGPLFDELGNIKGLFGIAHNVTHTRETEEALRKSDQRFRSMFESSMDAIFLTSPDGRIHSANPAACSMSGMTEEEIRAIGRAGLVVRDTLLLDALEERVRTGKFRGELNCIKKDGTVFPVEATSSVFRDGDGSEKTILIYRDITRRKEMEKTLLESENRYRSLFGNMQEGSAYCRMLFDANGVPIDFVYLDVNNAFERLTGLKNVDGKKISEVIPGIRELHPELFEIYGRVSLTGQPEKFEIEMKQLGAWFSLSVYSTEKEHFVAILDNITERKKAEESLRENEERWQLAIQGSNSGVWDWNVQTGETFYSESLKEMFGYGEPGRGNRFEELIDRSHPEDKERVRNELGKYLAGESGGFSMEYRVRCAGSYKWVLEWGKVISRTSTGKSLRMVGVVTDMTERKQLEEQLFQTQKMETVGRLAGGIAHGFNNILTAIVGFSQVLELKIPADDPLQKYIGQIQNCTERAAKLTEGLLSFSRTKIVMPRIVDLNDIIKSHQMILRTLVREHVELQLDLELSRLPVRIDTTKIEQVIMTLVSNANDSLSDKGVIVVNTSSITMNSEFRHAHGYGEPGFYACITVSDTGSGMDEETRRKVFDPFFTTKEVGKGTGLGLTVAYSIIKQHNGYISILSEAGKGTTFRIYLPLVKDK